MTTLDENQIPILNFHNPAGAVYYADDHGLYTYAMGNTRKRSITEQIGTTKEQHLDLLFLGCGDCRNVLCTVSELSQRRFYHCPKSIDIHLNDYDPSILPRNAIILDIIGHVNPDIPDDMDFLWNVWYNMALTEAHGDRLRQVITSLINRDMDDENGMILRFQDSRTQQECLSVWEDWVELGHLDVEAVKKERHDFNSKQFTSAEDISEHVLEKVALAICFKQEKTSMKYVQQEVDHWSKEASTTDDSDLINPTMICPFDNNWKINYNSSPFEGYMPFDACDITRQKSLTAVCKETLKLWVKRFQHYNKEHSVKISLWAGDALWLCTSGLPNEMLFDVIDTSNVSDHIGLLNVLICCGPRLKRTRESQLHTSSMLLWVGECESVQDYYTKCIGIDTNLLATVLGLHLAVDFDLGNRKLPDNGRTAEESLHWVKADNKRSILTLDKESDIVTALWNLTKRCFNLIEDLHSGQRYGASLSSPLTLLRVIHQMGPLVQGGAAKIFDLLERELRYDFYQKHGFTWKLLKSIAVQDGEPIIEVEARLEIAINEEGIAKKCCPIPMIVFLDRDDNVPLKVLFNRFENCPVMYHTIRFNIKENTVTFHMLEKDWEIIQPNFMLHIVDYRYEELDLKAFRCKPVALRDDDKINVHRVDPVATFGLFAVQKFQVSDEPSSLLKVVKVEEDENLCKAELDILDPDKCNSKDMRTHFTPESSPSQVDIYFKGVLGSSLRFSCPVSSSSSSTFRLSKKKNKLNCKVLKVEKMVSGEMALLNPAQVPFHAMTRWDAEVDDLDWTCNQMFRTESDFLMKVSGQRGPAFYRLRRIIAEMFTEHFKEYPQNPNWYHVGTTEKYEDDTEGFFIKVHDSLIYKWNHLPYVKCIFTDHLQNNDPEKAKRFALEMYGCTHRYIFTLPEEIELFRRMLCINSARTEQEHPSAAGSVWKHSFICPLYPREGVLNMKPEDMFQVLLRREMVNGIIDPISPHDNAKQGDNAERDDNFNEGIPDTDSTSLTNRCGFCQKPSEDLKKCMGCKEISYCNEDCQTKHWKIKHKYSCSRLRAEEVSTLRDSIHDDTAAQLDDNTGEEFWSSAHLSCAFCKKPSKSLKKCIRCEKVSYCDVKCQEQHWKGGHKDVCLDKITANVVTPDQDSVDGVKQEDHDKDEQRHCCDVCEHPLQVVLKRCTGCHKIFYYGDDTPTSKTCDMEKKTSFSEWSPPREEDSCRHGNQKDSVQATKPEQDAMDSRCTFCKEPSKNLKKCLRCEQVSYCTKECQRKHWEKHKMACHKKV